MQCCRLFLNLHSLISILEEGFTFGRLRRAEFRIIAVTLREGKTIDGLAKSNHQISRSDIRLGMARHSFHHRICNFLANSGIAASFGQPSNVNEGHAWSLSVTCFSTWNLSSLLVLSRNELIFLKRVRDETNLPTEKNVLFIMVSIDMHWNSAPFLVRTYVIWFTDVHGRLRIQKDFLKNKPLDFSDLSAEFRVSSWRWSEDEEFKNSDAAVNEPQELNRIEVSTKEETGLFVHYHIQGLLDDVDLLFTAIELMERTFHSLLFNQRCFTQGKS